MIGFIMLTISVTLAILLASVISVLVMMHPKVLKWYVKRVTKQFDQLNDLILVDSEREEEA